MDTFEDEVLLADNKFFEKPSIDMDVLIEHIEAKLLDKDKKFPEKVQDIIEKANYIITPESRERLLKIIAYINYGIPALLEGPTGTSKTLSVEIAAKIIDVLTKKKRKKKI